jgi:periplasmic protein TonB
MSRLSAWQSSLLLHSVLLAAAFAVVLWPKTEKEFIEVPIYQPVPENVQTIQPDTVKPVVLKSVNLNPEPAKPSRAVFGASRNTYTSGEGTVEAKRGNTLAKAVDDTVLTKDDADALPTPTDEFLVSQMPVVLSEVKPVYPAEAREARQEGAVVVDALIDASGAVRQATVLEGAEVFRAPALAAIKQFRFKPALVEGRPVAVRIRYTLRFRLEI